MINNLRKNYFLALILLAAFLIRVIGVYPGYPQIHPDEGMSYHSAVYLLYHWFRPDRFDYPAGVPFIHAVIYAAFFIPSMMLKIFITNPINMIELFINPADFFLQYKDAIFGPIEINAMYWSRYIAATFGTLTVLFVYLTAKRLFNKETGLFAAFFLAVNYRHVLGSHFGLPDVHNAFFAMLTLYASILLLEKNTRKRYLFAALAAGLAFSIKYQIFVFIPFFAAHLIWMVRERSVWYLFNSKMIVAGLCSIAVFLAINPYYLFNLSEAMYQNSLDILRYQIGIIRFRPYPYFYLFHWGIGSLPFITIISGMIVVIFTRSVKLILPLSYIFVFMFFMTYYSGGGGYPRNFVTVIPFLMIFAGYAMYVLFSLLKKNLNSSLSLTIIMVILFLINASSIKNSFILSYQYSMPWTSISLAQWMEKTLPQDITVRKYLLFLPPLTIDYLNKKNIKQIDWSYEKVPNSLVEFQDEGVDFAILNTYMYQSSVYPWRSWKSIRPYLLYETVPFEYIKNSFEGLTVRELMQYTVYEMYRPWQAQEVSNYLVFKIPPKQKELGKKIWEFGFSKDNDVWFLEENTVYPNPLKSKWNVDEGKKESGSLEIKYNSSFSIHGALNIARYRSEPIKISPGKIYTVRGWVKNDPQNRLGHDGFLRLDLYTSNEKKSLKSIGKAVAVSRRAPPNDQWVQVEASIKAPKDTEYLTISFQTEYFNLYPIYLDNVELFETDISPEERLKNIPYIMSTIPDESLYYNSFL